MDLAYVAHTESCALLLDEDGVCRWIVPRANATEQLIATSKRCIGARFVASLDPEVEGWLVHEPRVGSQLLFGLMIEDRFALVRVGPLLRFDTMDAKTRVEVIDEQPAALTERDFSRNATSSAPASEPAAEEPKPETAETARVSFTNEADVKDASDTEGDASEADADDLTLDRNAAAKLDAALVQRELVLDEDLPKTAELPAREEERAVKAEGSVAARVDAGATDYDDDIFSSLVAPKPAAAIEPLPAPVHEIYPAAREGVLDLDNDPDALANLFDDDDITNMFARMTTMPPATTMTSLIDDRDEIVTKNATKSYAPPPPPSLAPPASVRQSGFAIRVAPAASTSPSTTPVPVPPPTRRDVVAIQARSEAGVEGEETSPFSRVVHEWAAGQEDAASTMRLPLPGRGILPRKSNVR